MILQLYFGDELVDSTVLSLTKINVIKERELYIKGAINAMREKWSDLIEDQKLAPAFYIKGDFKF